jgi:hypothetical protein
MSAGALVDTGCGAGATTTPQEARLQRADLVAVSRVLRGLQRSTSSEVAATKVAWPHVANGLPAKPRTIYPAIHNASESAAALRLPPLFQEREARSLTGAAAGIAGLFRAFSGLSDRGWQLIGGAIEEIEHGSPATARFARANVPLYIESVYDAHFSLAQIGKQLTDGYGKLGGSGAFGTALTESEVDGLAHAYSEEVDRLHPHPGVRLGS